jgi:hypothetical protein
MIPRLVLALIFICSTGTALYAQQPTSPCQQSVNYIGKRDVMSPLAYEPISTTVVGGRISGALMRGTPEGLQQICLALFTERKHSFVASAITDAEGNFRFSDISAGRYRLIIRAPGFYVAEIPVRVLSKAKESKPINIVLQSVVMQQQ